MAGHSEATVGAVDIVLTVFLAGTVILIAADGSRRTQVGAYLSLGAVLSIVWLRLGVVDVALAEAALGGGVLSGVLVWLAVARPGAATQPVDEPPPTVPRRIRILTGLVTGTVLAVVLGSVILRTRQTTPAWTGSLTAGMQATGVEHEITAVLLDFRAYDTLLESAVLLFAGIIVLAVGTDRPREGRQPVPLPSIALWFLRVAAPVFLMLGLWLLFAGSSGPGGAFQSGSVLAGLLILLRLAGVDLRMLHRLLVPLMIIGVVVFLGMGLFGPLAGDPWLTWPEGRQFMVIFIIEVFLTVGITVALYALYLALENPGHRISSREGRG
ncbi:hypothetical protein EAH68_04055 [Corynebacterium hylobatis]|uniref:Na+/H+ antiporter MnhB subunit-related protein domain-containing protein n=1 Tax=Corynebacterium hylobatis TaxID=1859290 RepID=A0A3R9ZK50_9CORY|nr:MnhB domain-containing protein [Corynebacterium hylobatis]RSZ64781.1 hypothetical protein EAH68_04055 [Corynebacterium hylobatis]